MTTLIWKEFDKLYHKKLDRIIEMENKSKVARYNLEKWTYENRPSTMR